MSFFNRIAAGILVLASLCINPQSSWATKGGTPLAHAVSSDAVVNPGGSLTYRFTVQNTAGINYRSVVFSSTLPAGVTCQSASDAACTIGAGGNTIVCMYGAVPPGTAFTVTASCQVAQNVGCNSKITTTMGLWVKEAPKQDTYATTVSTVVCPSPTPTSTSTPLPPTATSTPTQIPPTATPTYTVYYPPTQTPTQTPTETPYPPTATATATRTATPRPSDVPTLAPTATSTPAATRTPTPSYSECSDGKDNDGDGQIDYPNDSGCTDANDESEDSQGLTVTKTVAETVSPGTTVKYTYAVTNTTNHTISGVVAEDFNIKNKSGSKQIRQQFEYDHAVNANCDCGNGSNIVSCTLGDIAAGQTHTFEIYFTVPDGQDQCGLDVTNQVDVFDATKNSNFYNWAKATTRVVCDDSGTTCEHDGEYYFTNRYDLLDCSADPNDRAQQQAANIVKKYGLVVDSGPRRGWYGGVYRNVFWYQSKTLRKTLPADQCWFYLVPKTGVLRIWNPNNRKGNPADDIFVAQLGGGLDACGVCGGDTSSCQIR